MENRKSKPLSMIKEGSTVVVVGIEAGHGLKNRLTEMGMINDTRIKVINNNHPGPFVIDLKGSKLAIGRGMANKIIVKEVE
jgi:Fe2+ transport system protein FeoA